MPILRWRCEHGEAPTVDLACATVVDLSPQDGSVHSNTVYISGEGTIESFGNGPAGERAPQGRAWGLAVTKTVVFDAGITLKHSDRLLTLSGRDRVMATACIGIYRCNGGGRWVEVHFAATGSAEATRRLETIERRLDEIDERLRKLEPG